MNEFMPRSAGQLVLWLTNYSNRIATYGKSLGLSATEISAQQKRCDEIIDAIKNDDEKQKDWRSAVRLTRTAKQQGLPEIRGVIARLKVAPGWTPAIGQAMGVVGAGGQSLQPGALDAAKPKVRAEAVAGRVHIKFTRSPFDGINIYTRKKGEGSWRFLSRATKSPYIDPTPLAAANVAEVREYQVLGVRKDQEVGQASDVVVIPVKD